MIIALFLVKGLVVLAASIGLGAALRRRPAVLRDRLWTLTFAALLVVVAAPLFLPSWSLPAPARPATAAAAGVPAPVAAATPSARPSPGDAALALPPPVRDAGPGPRAVDPGALLAWLVKWLAIVWAAGAAILLARLGVELRSLRRVRTGAREADRRTRRIGGRAAAALGLGTAPRIRLSDAVPVPMATGGRRQPTVLLPLAARHWSPRRLEAVLLHELAHVRRSDPLFALVAAIACALHWMNPLAWWAVRRATADREEACDMMVLAAGADRYHYARDLLDIARAAAGPRRVSFYGAAPHMASPSSLGRRIRALLDDGSPVAALGRRASRAMLAVAVVAVLPIACARVGGAPDAPVAAVSPDTAIARLLDATARPEARLNAAWQLGDLEDKQAVDALVAALDDGDPALRGMAAWALGEIKETSALPALVAATDDDDPVAGEMAIRAIGEIDDEAAVAPLIDIAASEDEVQRAAAIRALSDLDWSPEAREAVEAALADPSAVVRKSAVMALGESAADADTAPALLPLLYDDAADVRALTAQTLGILGSPRTVDALIAATRDPNPEVRFWTVWALDEIRQQGR